MEISEALIQRFLKGACNAEEAEAVLSYLESHPDAMEHYLGQEEWNQVSTSTVDLKKSQSVRMLENIQRTVWKNTGRKSPWLYVGVAAALAIIVGTLFFLPAIKTPVTHPIPQYASDWKFIRNEAKQVQHYKLEDGSEVDLDPGAEISLPAHFSPDRRDIKLVGRALFQVAKDSKRPFSVLAENTSTTALGTKFLINAQSADATTEVSLLEGKVMIRVANAGGDTYDEYYLLPDQQLIHTKQSGSIIIKPIKDHQGTRFPLKKAADIYKAEQPVAAIAFYRSPVVDVFWTLAQRYHVKIDYPAAGLQSHYFTGSFHAEDTLDRMLQVIAEVNDLEVRKTKSGYQVIKIKNKFHQ